ncbi:hypothetical protein [Rhizobium halophytocola]|uniref:Uncharacterized protein n=1 Tax=Rhizobium halophytocola TaxID=735519 RepID=A0ABS4DSB1_9HYPH|nr:hypothetical protein [Rhizobium halophytocola]MBP1848593.1 hypothetical protein [Rhizobium halophytocola]
MRVLLTAVLSLCASSVPAHEARTGWRYDSYCCNGDGHSGDCQQIPSKSVSIIQGGYKVTLAPGDHRLATHAHIFHGPQDRARKSHDSEYHLCLFPDENTPRCFYAPDMGF